MTEQETTSSLIDRVAALEQALERRSHTGGHATPDRGEGTEQETEGDHGLADRIAALERALTQRGSTPPPPSGAGGEYSTHANIICGSIS